MNGSLVTQCQICGNSKLETVLDLGWLPPVNTFRKIGTRPGPEVRWPAELLLCRDCSLVQMGFIPPPEEVFPSDYSYRSGTTKALRNNFEELAKECRALFSDNEDYTISVLDVGCNDGTLLDLFREYGFWTRGFEPTDVFKIAREGGHVVSRASFTKDHAEGFCSNYNHSNIVTACNVFAHTPEPHDFVEGVKAILAPGGTFVVEVQNLWDLQFDTVYHEHLRYYCLTSLSRLFDLHDMKIVQYKHTKIHGGSIRVYVARKEDPRPAGGTFAVDSWEMLKDLAVRTDASRRSILFHVIGSTHGSFKIYGIGCPSRAVTLINYVGLQGFLDCVCEVPGSPKIGGYVPGTSIPVVDEAKLYADQPDYALLLSWHLADELISKIKAKGFRGRFIVPLPTVRIV